MNPATKERGTGRHPEPHGPARLPASLLLLEDDPKLRRVFAGRLRAAGHRVDEVPTLRAARRALSSARYDCLVLDRMVPDGDAIDLVAELEGLPERAAMVILSGLAEQPERVAGLRAGADDYVTKPVLLDELVVRVANATEWDRRAGDAAAGSVLRVGHVEIDRCARTLRVAGQRMHLTPHQFMVLEYLAVRHDQVVLTEELLEHCWDDRRPLFANPLPTQVTRLRAVLRGHLEILAVHGGYLLRVADEP